MFKKLEKKYNDIFLKYQKYYLVDYLNKSYYKEGIINIEKDLLKLLILYLFCDNEINKDIKEKIENYILKYKNLIFLKLFKEKTFLLL